MKGQPQPSITRPTAGKTVFGKSASLQPKVFKELPRIGYHVHHQRGYFSPYANRR